MSADRQGTTIQLFDHKAVNYIQPTH